MVQLNVELKLDVGSELYRFQNFVKGYDSFILTAFLFLGPIAHSYHGRPQCHCHCSVGYTMRPNCSQCIVGRATTSSSAKSASVIDRQCIQISPLCFISLLGILLYLMTAL